MPRKGKVVVDLPDMPRPIQDGNAPLHDEISHLKDPATGEKLGQYRVKHRVNTESGLFNDEVRAGDHLLQKTATKREGGNKFLVEEFAERDQDGTLLGTREVTWEPTGIPGQTELTKSVFTPARSYAIGWPEGYQPKVYEEEPQQ